MSHTLLRRLGIFVLLLPVIIAAPLIYWASHYAGSWYSATDLEPELRRLNLYLTNVMVLAMTACLTWFPGLLLLYASGLKRRLIGWLLLPAGLLLLPGVFLLYTLVYCYVNYG